MKHLWWAGFGLIVALLGTLDSAAAQTVRAKRQQGIQSILTRMAPATIADLRANCVAGDPALGTPMLLNATGASFSLSPAELCITVLTRAGRDGTLGYVTLRSGATTPAIAFDTGFVGGYLKREPLPASAPTIAALLPVAARCIDQKETNTRLCSSAGYVLGARAAQGELVPIS